MQDLIQRIKNFVTGKETKYNYYITFNYINGYGCRDITTTYKIKSYDDLDLIKKIICKESKGELEGMVIQNWKYFGISKK